MIAVRAFSRDCARKKRLRSRQGANGLFRYDKHVGLSFWIAVPIAVQCPFHTATSTRWGTQAASLFFSAACRKDLRSFGVVGKLPTTAGRLPPLSGRITRFSLVTCH